MLQFIKNTLYCIENEMLHSLTYQQVIATKTN